MIHLAEELSPLEMGGDVQGSRTRIEAEPNLGAYIFQTPLPAFLQSLFDYDKSSLGRVMMVPRCTRSSETADIFLLGFLFI